MLNFLGFMESFQKCLPGKAPGILTLAGHFANSSRKRYDDRGTDDSGSIMILLAASGREGFRRQKHPKK
jgi:hypothetical protein